MKWLAVVAIFEADGSIDLEMTGFMNRHLQSFDTQEACEASLKIQLGPGGSRFDHVIRSLGGLVGCISIEDTQ